MESDQPGWMGLSASYANYWPGGLQPLAILGSAIKVRGAVSRINDFIMNINSADIFKVLDE